MSDTTLTIEERPVTGGVATWVWMNRPEVHNAFNAQVIAELTEAFQALSQTERVRVVILAGRGKSFSAGADLDWMKAAGAASEAENREDAMRLAEMLAAIATCRKPTIARVHGAALGGGMGLACACDICVASERAQFGTTEVRFGIIPSAISPYVLRAIGPRQALRYFQTGERIPAARALALGIAHEVAPETELDSVIDGLIAELVKGGPNALWEAKSLVAAVAHQPIDAALRAETAARIARVRATPEAREGLAAFLEKRPARWIAES
ncbi:enoyl-CoA hydratase/isomerase family protein [Hydrogenophilus thermoluteolus]|uniref:Enoyl-CoA hydratase n=2 Tax=Hydrogenophilus thermoluteolus TaxID=297 RepID=A0A2Z6DVS1_HYDTE|nr:enoyl-CoA hydratase/isomerase family protein [Hydrogenophilus thermoluteolus]BBD76542.1 enoyl-CoA hydratase [Hydrogenophilus thermoluteolus]